MNMDRDNPDALNAWQQLADIARLVLGGEISVVEAVRAMSALRYRTGRPDDELFLPIIAIESDTDHFPLGAVREHYDATYMQRLDAELQAYLADVEEECMLLCKEIGSRAGLVLVFIP